MQEQKKTERNRNRIERKRIGSTTVNEDKKTRRTKDKMTWGRGYKQNEPPARRQKERKTKRTLEAHHKTRGGKNEKKIRFQITNSSRIGSRGTSIGIIAYVRFRNDTSNRAREIRSNTALTATLSSSRLGISGKHKVTMKDRKQEKLCSWSSLYHREFTNFLIGRTWNIGSISRATFRSLGSRRESGLPLRRCRFERDLAERKGAEREVYRDTEDEEVEGRVRYSSNSGQTGLSRLT